MGREGGNRLEILDTPDMVGIVTILHLEENSSN